MLKVKSFECKAHAKINLFLNVYDKTKDNLHNLKSLIYFIDLYDEITISESKTFSIIVKGPFKNYIKKKNIIEKTFLTFSNFLNLKKNYRICLNKRIPVTAGLGGGSADAAAVLKGLNYLSKKKIKKKDLYKIAATIGSDVPVCLFNNNAFFSGYGEILSKSPKIPKFSILLINPRKELSTKKVFNAYNFLKKKKTNKLNYKNFFLWILKQNNDLQKYSEKFVPEINHMIEFLNSSNNCFFSSMTGSGPTVFGLFKRKIDANKANIALKKKNPKWWSGVYSAKT